jgi:hypothetical protein
MRGFKIVCLASSYSDRDLVARKGWTVVVGESDPLVAKLRLNPAFKFTPCEVPDQPTPVTASKKVAPTTPADEAPTTAPSGDDDIALVPNIKPELVAAMKAKGLDTVAAAIAAGIDGLDELEGVGVPTANAILLACAEYLGE